MREMPTKTFDILEKEKSEQVNFQHQKQKTEMEKTGSENRAPFSLYSHRFRTWISRRNKRRGRSERKCKKTKNGVPNLRAGCTCKKINPRDRVEDELNRSQPARNEKRVPLSKAALLFNEPFKTMKKNDGRLLCLDILFNLKWESEKENEK